MRKYISYSIFFLAGAIVVYTFISATNFLQLAGASLLYLPLALFGFKIFSTNPTKLDMGSVNIFHAPSVQVPKPAVVPSPKKQQAEVSISKQADGGLYINDIDKRAFLKILGATGLSFFLFSILGRRVDSLAFGNNLGSGLLSPQTSTSEASVTAGYRISEIDDTNSVTYYGFINNSGGWLIMKEDANAASYRYAKGDSGFAGNWASREDLNYDYFHNLN